MYDCARRASGPALAAPRQLQVSPPDGFGSRPRVTDAPSDDRAVMQTAPLIANSCVLSRLYSPLRGARLSGRPSIRPLIAGYRTALAAILERHLRLDDRRLTQIFSGLLPTGPT